MSIVNDEYVNPVFRSTQYAIYSENEIEEILPQCENEILSHDLKLLKNDDDDNDRDTVGIINSKCATEAPKRIDYYSIARIYFFRPNVCRKTINIAKDYRYCYH